MHRFWRNFRGALGRTFPDAQVFAQATAFNSFLALFPMLLVILGTLTLTPQLTAAVGDIITRLLEILPNPSRQTVVDYLLTFGDDPVTWILLGLGGTLLAGGGAMASLTQGFRAVHRDEPIKGFWREQLRALGLLGMTFVPWMLSALITVFGRQLREWAIHHFGLSWLFNLLWAVVYTSLALVLAMITLALVYRYGRGRPAEWSHIWPGTFVATGLWWVVNVIFGYYVREVPYGVIYGGLAAAIGLLIWLYLSAIVVYIGAGFNAEAEARAPEPVYGDALRINSGAVPAAEEVPPAKKED